MSHARVPESYTISISVKEEDAEIYTILISQPSYFIKSVCSAYVHIHQWHHSQGTQGDTITHSADTNQLWAELVKSHVIVSGLINRAIMPNGLKTKKKEKTLSALFSNTLVTVRLKFPFPSCWQASIALLPNPVWKQRARKCPVKRVCTAAIPAPHLPPVKVNLEEDW